VGPASLPRAGAIQLSAEIAHIVEMVSTERCINKLRAAVVMKDTTAEEINEYIRKNCTEYYKIPPNFRFKCITVLLKTPMLVGFKIKKKKILLPFEKICFGPILYEINATEDDFEFIRNAAKNEEVPE
jgi:hypothetical protein